MNGLVRSVLRMLAAAAFPLATGPSAGEAASMPPQPPLAAAAPPEAKPPGPSAAVMVIGDSLAVGLNPRIRALALKDGMTFIDGAPKGGTMISQWSKKDGRMKGNGFLYSRLADDIARMKKTGADHKVALVSFGTNDNYSGQWPDTNNNLPGMLKEFRDAGIEVCWIGPPKLPSSIRSFVTPGARVPRRDDILENLKSHFDAAHWVPSDTLPIPQQPDHIHPTVQGYDLWAGKVFDYMKTECLKP